MNKMKKALVLMLCAVLLVVGSVLGTLAYLTSQDTVVNTFTVGDVEITLDEANVNEMGELIDGNRVETNDYHLLPGHSYIKDPTVTIKKGSENCYVRMQVTVADIAKMKAAFPKDDADFAGFYATYGGNEYFMLQNLVDGWNKDIWECVSITENTNGSATYEFWYNTIAPGSATADIVLPALFTSVEVPGAINNAQLEYLQGAEITVVAHAIQADGFADAAAAWAAWAPEIH